MSKAYSNKALPAGTVIREWRLEEVLGVGGFGIVYKGRGIYFGELVAIKEYFPSSIADRDAEATVVPIGSDVEEVHALGLKKFVEEAKLLWNLSTPSRHPNIVSVRALFEVHGTAYMVMDFEDGVSLSKLLRDGRRFNERSLWGIFQPIAEGLARAHRVGVLHRDIKPPNVLINEDGRPVLIDFGSARFEAAEATSTSVTFHTPPYAAIEQYVKTYEQGPWTDIYALAVMLHECVTGEKPPEVLERLHGGLGKPLAEGHWPGYSPQFLAAVDAGMTIKPAERPQSISEWLPMFGKRETVPAVDEGDAPTRFFAHEVEAAEIVPVALPADGPEEVATPPTQVPASPADAEFKRAGQDTVAGRKLAPEAIVPVEGDAEASAPLPPEPEPVASTDTAPPKSKPAAATTPSAASAKPGFLATRPGQLALGAAAVVLAGVSGAYFVGHRGQAGGGAAVSNIAISDAAIPSSSPTDVAAVAKGEQALIGEAQAANAPEAAVAALQAASAEIDRQVAAAQRLAGQPAKADALAQQTEAISNAAIAANLAFAKALADNADTSAQRQRIAVPASDPSVQAMKASLAQLRAAAVPATAPTDPAASLTIARDALAKSGAAGTAIATAARAKPGKPDAVEIAAAKPGQPRTPKTEPVKASAISNGQVSDVVASSAPGSRIEQMDAIVNSGRAAARQIFALGRASGASPQAKANVDLAKSYDNYLARSGSSIRGAKSDAEAQALIKQANLARNYLVFLLHKSKP
ncbi:serine/threonine-protein kinase [Sphingomonas sp. ASV193]|uniref:serine/threonine protein kinase n=1 Tax=Sphingomonas sp. ASV193 TaxID=3144405 RepID=UPI0032E8EC21